MAIPRQEVERAQAEEVLARSALTGAEAEVARTQAALHQLGVSESGLMVVRAPAAGVVLSRDAVPGAVVSPGTPLVSTTDPSTLWLDLSVSDQAAATLRSGSRVRFAVPTFPADTFEARVVSVGSALDSQTRRVIVRAVVPNGAGRLRAQTFATVWLDRGGGARGVAVPEGAIMLLDQRPVVFVAHPMASGAGGDSVRFERRDVETGGQMGGMVQILRGLTPGELVVTEGAFAVKSEYSRSKTPAEG